MDWIVEYRPGDGLLLVGQQRCVLLALNPGLSAWTRAWQMLSSGADMLSLLEALAEHDLATLPGAAVLVEEPDGALVLLRGSARAVSDGEPVRAKGRYTWAEAQVDAGALLVCPGDDPVPDDGSQWLPLVEGAAPCGAFRVRRLTSTAQPADPAVSTQGPATVADAPDAALGRDAPDVATGDLDVAPGQVDKPDGPQAGESAAAESTEAWEGPGAEPAAATGLDGSPTGSAAQPGPPVSADPEMPDTSQEGGDDDYDRLFGATSLMQRSNEHASAVGDEVPTEVPSERSTASDAAPEPVGDPVVPPVQDPPPPQNAGSTASGLIDAVPGIVNPVPGVARDPGHVTASGAWPPFQPTGPSSGQDAPGGEPQAPDEAPSGEPEAFQDDISGDHDGRTVLRPPRRGASAVAESVRAIVCPVGHANPPEAVACRACGADIGDVPIQTIARPSMGVLRHVGGPPGPEIDLDRTTILGRKPSTSGPGGAVRLVRLDDPQGELSRNHARIALEGWHVLVTDLGSTNGTVLEVPGHPPVRLRRGDATPVSPGTVIVLADTVRLLFEAR